MLRIVKRFNYKEAVRSYFSIIINLNKLKVGEKELTLLTDIAVEGDRFNRDRWILSNKSSYASYYNMRGRLTKSLLLKKGRIHPALKIDFSNIKMEIEIYGNTERD